MKAEKETEKETEKKKKIKKAQGVIVLSLSCSLPCLLVRSLCKGTDVVAVRNDSDCN